ERVNHRADPARALAELPLEAVAYVHIAGGELRGGLWHDTHAAAVPPAVLEILTMLCERRVPPGVLLERDGAFPPPDELADEMAAIRRVVEGAGVRG
ncbi:MAG: DUF692 family protein, partial [Streptomycetaceae bacterium]|nr:DUF692 family protein [Streptomycetaceae bacterium]